MTLTARHVDVSIEGETLVRDVSIDCEPGEVVGLVGPNGAGKIMFLSALSGRRAASGEARYDGRPLEQWDERSLARRRGILRQRTRVPFDFSVREVVELGEIPWRGRGESRTLGEGPRYLEAVGLVEFVERSYPTLSGGEKRRAQLARILLQIRALEFQIRALESTDTARWLLLDEPLASLDIGEATRVQQLVRRVARCGVAVLAVFHDLNAAAAVADSVVLLKNGRSLARGPPETTMTEEHIERCFETEVSVTVETDGALVVRSQLNRISHAGDTS